MRKTLTVFLALPLLAACAETEQAADQIARQSAKAAVDEVIVTRFPGVDGTGVTPYTDCVIDNASAREISKLAQAALLGVTESTVQLVFDIAQRPEAARCLLEVGLKDKLASSARTPVAFREIHGSRAA